MRVSTLKKRILSGLENEKTFMVFQYDLVDEIASSPIEGLVAPLVVGLIRDNPEVDFGVPGPLVYWLEERNEEGYFEELLRAFEVAPCDNLLFMITRWLRGKAVVASQRGAFISVASALLESASLEPELVDSISEAVQAAKLFEGTS